MSVLFNPDIPFHYQIYLQITSEINNGLWVGKDDFPGEAGLAERFGVSVITSRKALNRLAEEGWIEKGRGKRTKVIRAPKVNNEGAPAVFLGEPSSPYTYTLLSKGLVISNAEACEKFNLPLGSNIWQCSRLRFFAGKLHSLAVNFQLPEIGNKHKKKDLDRLPMYQILMQAGKIPVTAQRRIVVSSADDTIANHLSVPLHTPLLTHNMSLSDEAGEILEWVQIYLHPDQSSPVEDYDFSTNSWHANTLS
ncbi:hypothetical protein R50073_13220 [Maricurvus nonylphenolicus]|uniref:GntR family transcriptional regulator n=1 Tax=Maricurvus nonylphenolicus TaxID=1008307 RepID=UPI0036F39F62